MSILIKGMEMPTAEYGPMTITIYPNGDVREYIGDIGRVWDAIPVPPHGALIDVDKIPWTGGTWESDFDYVIKKQVNMMPTIIEAEDGT